MADDPKIAHGQDRERINVNQPHELRDWSKKLGVTPERLKEAVQAVGDRAGKVLEHLRKKVSDKAAAGPHIERARSGNTMGDGRSGAEPQRKPAKRSEER